MASKYGVPKYLPDGSRNPEYTRRVNALIRDSPAYKDYQRKWRKANSARCAEYTRKYREKNREKLLLRDREYQKWYREAHPEKVKLRNRQLALQRHGMTLAEYKQILRKQRNRCKICRKPHVDKPGKRLCIDHCHKSGKNRGLICAACNTVLGHAKDNPRTLIRAAQYLRGEI